MALVVELGPAEDGGHGATKKHGVEEYKSANRRVRVFAEDHEGDEPDGGLAQAELLGRVVSHGDANDAKQGVECPHKGEVDILGIFLARLELEGTVVAGKDSRETDEHLAEWGVDVEVVFVLDVVASKLAKAVRTHRVSQDST